MSSYTLLARDAGDCAELYGCPEMEHLDVDVEPDPLTLRRHPRFLVVAAET